MKVQVLCMSGKEETHIYTTQGTKHHEETIKNHSLLNKGRGHDSLQGYTKY